MEIITIGEHRLTCASIEHGVDELMQGLKADLFYSDPPWGAPNLKYWRTIAKKAGHEFEQMSCENFVNTVCSIARKHAKGGFAAIEYSVRLTSEILGAASRNGLTHRATFTAYYGKGFPNHVHVFSDNPIAQHKMDMMRSLENSSPKDIKVVKGFVSALTAGIDTPMILDPCCGLGGTAKAAVGCGGVFRGNEVNPKRLRRTQEWLENRS